MEIVKGVDKAFLGLPLAADKVDVVNQQHINTSIFIAEFSCFSLLNSIYKLISKLLGANIEYLNMTGQSHMTNSMQ